MDNSYRLFPLGERAITVQFGEHINEDTHNKVQAFCRLLEEWPIEGMVELVPAFATVTVFYDPWTASREGQKQPYEEAAAQVAERINRLNVSIHKEKRLIEIPVCYGGEYGPDLEFVAGHNGLTEEEVIRIHSGGEYLVYMIGFAPGFPYIGGMSERIAAPRKSTPSKAIPKGSVGIAGMQTGVYPLETPGGWQLIGRTPLALFQPERTPPTLLQAGDLIRFKPISRQEYKELEGN